MEKRINVTRTFLPPLEEYIDEIRVLWDSHWITNMGDKHENLEKRLKDYLKVQELSLMCNGHLSLELCLQSMELSGEIITTPFTFASTTHAIVRNGLTPVFCDIRPDDYTMDAEQIEALITERTSAILPVHVYGNVCDTDRIQEIADRYHLKVIYDAAHAFGVEIDGKGIGSLGDASVFSFHATKVFHTIEGGAVCFSDPELGKKLYHLKNFGIMSEDEIDGIGANAKMNEFQAAMGLCNLRYMEEIIRRRKNLWEMYHEHLSDLQGIQLPVMQAGVRSNYAYFPILIEEEAFGCSRDEAVRYLADRGIMVRKYFYPLTSDFACYRGKLNRGKTPVADKTADSVITLPLYPELSPECVSEIIGALQKLQRERKGWI